MVVVLSLDLATGQLPALSAGVPAGVRATVSGNAAKRAVRRVKGLELTSNVS